MPYRSSVDANEPRRKYLIEASLAAGLSRAMPTNTYEHNVMSSRPRKRINRSSAEAASIIPVDARRSSAKYSAGGTRSDSRCLTDSSAASARFAEKRRLKNRAYRSLATVPPNPVIDVAGENAQSEN